MFKAESLLALHNQPFKPIARKTRSGLTAALGFMEAMHAARFNAYWYLSLAVPLIVMLVATYWRKKSILWVGIAVSLVSTYLLCNAAVQTKWQTRWEIAKTEEEQRFATADGANLVFTAFIIGPFEAISYTTVWGLVGWRVWGRIHKHAKQT